MKNLDSIMSQLRYDIHKAFQVFEYLCNDYLNRWFVLTKGNYDDF